MIGVAIAIPEPWAADLQAQRAAFGDPQASAIPTHITLVPPTDVGDDLSAVEKHLTEVAAQQTFLPPPAAGDCDVPAGVTGRLLIVVSEGISACELLAQAARSGPLEQELNFPYHPHVTVAHHLDEAALDHAYETLADFDCGSRSTDFHLYRTRRRRGLATRVDVHARRVTRD